jgi:hypothetical protein
MIAIHYGYFREHDLFILYTVLVGCHIGILKEYSLSPSAPVEKSPMDNDECMIISQQIIII